MKREWKSADDSVFFWAKHGDDDTQFGDADPSVDDDDTSKIGDAANTPIKLALMQRLGELSQGKCTCGLSKISCVHGDRLFNDNCAVGLKVRAVTDLSPVSFEDVSDVEDGAVGVVREFACERTYMCGDELIPQAGTGGPGVISVLWGQAYSRTIHARYDGIVIESHGDGSQQQVSE